MAIIKLKGKPEQTITAEQGSLMWRILNGEEEGTEKQQEYCRHIEKLNLNWRNAPKSYIEARKDILYPLIISTFMRNERGAVTRAEVSDKDARKIAIDHGLCDTSGRITQKGAIYIFS